MPRPAIHPIKLVLTKAIRIAPITPASTLTKPETLKSYPLHKLVIAIHARIGSTSARRWSPLTAIASPPCSQQESDQKFCAAL
jgi:hypothetical protein